LKGRALHKFSPAGTSATLQKCALRYCGRDDQTLQHM
jgi:hypothetical protein